MIVPVHMGSPRFTTLEVDGFRVIDAWFPPGEVLPFHSHDRTVFATMLEGSFLDRIGRSEHRCDPATVFTEPLGEPHENVIERAGARVVVVQPDPSRDELLRPVRKVLERVDHFRSGEIAALARRLGREVRGRDAAATVQAEALVLEMLAVAALIDPDQDAGRPPGWLDRARDAIHDRYRQAPTVEEIARDAGVHRVHLARTFRAYYHVPIGTYIRRLRLEWSAARLLEEEGTISAVALRAGFADQSHFTRAFKDHLGMTPGAYRRSRIHG